MDQQVKPVKTNSDFKDYLIIFLQNKLLVIAIFIACLVVAIVYSFTAIDIYSAEGSLKISIPKSNILSGPLMAEFQEFGTDRYIANELEVLKSISLREIAAKSLIDSFNTLGKKDSFYLLLADKRNPSAGIKQFTSVVKTLYSSAVFDQKRGLDIINISAESPSSYEAALIVNCYISAYYTFNLKINREQLTLTREFLEEQKKLKLNSLENSEKALKAYQETGKIVALDQQAQLLVEKISSFESLMNQAEIDIKSKLRSYNELKSRIGEMDQKVAKYIETVSTEPYVKYLQEEIAKLEVQKQVVSQGQVMDATSKIELERYTNSIKDLQSKLNEKLSSLQVGLMAYAPNELKGLSLDLLKLDLEIKSSMIRANEFKKAVNELEVKFNKLPEQTIELAKLQRTQKGEEKLFLLLEEKYQESMISEKSKPGNVQIIDAARVPTKPAKPNRSLIVIAGAVLGLLFGFGLVFMKKYFNVTVRTPEDIQNKGVNVLGWIPKADDFFEDFKPSENELIIESKPDSIPAESFLSIKMKLQFSRLTDTSIKYILITSPTPSEGKTYVCSNLAATFAITNNKTLIMDLDLRRPRTHTVFKIERHPGLTDYLFEKATLNEIIKPTRVKNLDIIPAGTITPNPAEIVSSQKLTDFLASLGSMYDFILIDTPPIVAVADAGVLSRLCDATVLVVSTNSTRLDLMETAINTLNSVQGHFIGVLLNNFSVRNGYGSYYRYYHYYSKKYKPGTGKKK